ncbi:MAG: hypothetical protein LC114_11415 [Bryobacterales bacterium]|nr:hypothetical protein [Bryobacterales bacterium]
MKDMNASKKHTSPFAQLAFSLALAILTASTGSAQRLGSPSPIIPVVPQLPAALQQYLGLSDTQASQINALNQQLTQLLETKAQRQIQLQVELAQEMRRPSLDPIAIGARYAELEQIRRDIEAERARTAASIQTTFTEAQKGKLTALQAVIRDYPMACQAISQNLLPPVAGAVINPNVNPALPAGVTGSFASFVLGSGGGCPVVASASRVGLFSPTSEPMVP